MRLGSHGTEQFCLSPRTLRERATPAPIRGLETRSSQPGVGTGGTGGDLGLFSPCQSPERLEARCRAGNVPGMRRSAEPFPGRAGPSSGT